MCLTCIINPSQKKKKIDQFRAKNSKTPTITSFEYQDGNDNFGQRFNFDPPFNRLVFDFFCICFAFFFFSFRLQRSMIRSPQRSGNLQLLAKKLRFSSDSGLLSSQFGIKKLDQLIVEKYIELFFFLNCPLQEFHLSQTYHDGLLKLQAKDYDKARELLESILKDPIITNSKVKSSSSLTLMISLDDE